MSVVLEILFLSVGVLFTMINLGKFYAKDDVPWGNMTLWALGVTGFIVLHWLL